MIQFCRILFRFDRYNNNNNNNNNIIICDIYIAPSSARSCSKALYNIIYNIIIPDSDLFPPSTYLNSQGSIHMNDVTQIISIDYSIISNDPRNKLLTAVFVTSKDTHHMIP